MNFNERSTKIGTVETTTAPQKTNGVAAKVDAGTTDASATVLKDENDEEIDIDDI